MKKERLNGLFGARNNEIDWRLLQEHGLPKLNDEDLEELSRRLFWKIKTEPANDIERWIALHDSVLEMLDRSHAKAALNSAKQDAKAAHKVALAAILISIGVGVGQICVGLLQVQATKVSCSQCDNSDTQPR